MRRRSIPITGLLAVLVIAISSFGAHPAARSAPSELASFKPRLLDPDAELVNPMRGLFRWNEQEVAPQPRAAYDSYRRYSWSWFEPSAGAYDFSVLERDLVAAERAGRKHGIRVRSMILGEGMAIPEHLAGRLERGWWSRETYVPDWNDPDFLAAHEAFVQEFARRYDGDPRISYVEIGAYGTWGEWNMYPFSGEYPTSGGAELAKTENLYRLVDMYVAAFRQTRLSMMSDNKPALVYALRQSPTIGWRRDSLGSRHFATGMESLKSDPEAWALVSERWKTAPVIAEFINPGGVSAPEVYELSYEQAREFHVAMLGNGNTLSWDGLSSTSRAAFLKLGRALGYRYELSELQLPARLSTGASFEVRSSWRNAGIAPTYEGWDVLLQLRPQGGEGIAWEGRLGVDLRTLLPAEGAVSTANSTTLRLGRGLASGAYEVTLVVRDPGGYRAPLALALEGGLADGAYRLGTVSVAQGSGLAVLEPQVYLPLLMR